MSTDPTQPLPPVPPASTHEDPGAGGPPPPEPAPGLYRSATDRMLFGVCGGVAERYGFEPVLVRLAFVLTLFLGGAGVLFYLAAAVLIPAAPAADGAPGSASGGAVGAANGVLRTLVALAVAIAVFCSLGTIAAGSFLATVLLGGWPVALALVLIGVLLVATSRSRRTVGSLLVLALALAVPATAAVVADVRVDRSFGDREVRPATQARAAQGYRLGVGRLVVDLRDLDLRRGDRVRVPASVDVGQLGVVLPRDRCVAWTVDADTGFASSDVLGNRGDDTSWGTDAVGDRTVEIDPVGDRGSRRPRVTLDLRTRVGEVVVAYSRRDLDRMRSTPVGTVRHGDDLLRTAACRPDDRERGGR